MDVKAHDGCREKPRQPGRCVPRPIKHARKRNQDPINCAADLTWAPGQREPHMICLARGRQGKSECKSVHHSRNASHIARVPGSNVLCRCRTQPLQDIIGLPRALPRAAQFQRLRCEYWHCIERCIGKAPSLKSAQHDTALDKAEIPSVSDRHITLLAKSGLCRTLLGRIRRGTKTYSKRRKERWVNYQELMRRTHLAERSRAQLKCIRWLPETPRLLGLHRLL